MNRYAFLGAQTDESGQEWCYVLDTQTGTTLKSPVKAFGAAPERKVETVTSTTERAPLFPVDTVTAPVAVKKDVAKPDPEGELETAEQREYRIKHPKVPAAFSSRMMMDPGKTNGVTDVTQPQ